MHGFTPDFWCIVSQHLQLGSPDHFPNDLYKLSDLHKAAHYILHGTPSAALITSTLLPVPMTHSASARPKIKTEDITALLKHINDTMAKLLMAHVTPQRPPPLKNMNCHFCRLPDHLGWNCMVTADYITQGKCRQNTEGLIVLWTGAFIPHDILGRYLKDHIDKWHNHNPGQNNTGQLMYNVLLHAVIKLHSHALATCWTHSDLFDDLPMLSTDQHIQTLEWKLLQLHARNAAPKTWSKGPPVCEAEEEPKEAQLKQKVLWP